jgi:hypothetical protein
MQALESQLNKVVQDFVAQVALLAQRSALASLQRALRQAAPSPIEATRRMGSREKRTQDQLAALADSFYSFVARYPGLRIEQINKQLHTTTKDLARPIRGLVASGAIKTKGRKRSTTYYAGERPRSRS